MKELEENNGRKAYLEIKKKLEDASDATFGQMLLTRINMRMHFIMKSVSGKRFPRKKSIP